MKKTILILTLGILLIAVHLYAADLNVTGKLTVGQDEPGWYPINLYGYNTPRFIEAGVTDDRGATVYAYSFGVQRTGNAEVNSETVSMLFGTSFFNNSNITGHSVVPLKSVINFSGSDDNTFQVTSTDIAGFISLWRSFDTSRWDVTSVAADIRSDGMKTARGASEITFSDFRHFYVKDSTAGTFLKQSGLWIDQQTRGNVTGGIDYGIVLDGDGAGADIVFGPNQESMIYGMNGNLMIDTSNSVDIGVGDPMYHQFRVDGRIEAYIPEGTGKPAIMATVGDIVTTLGQEVHHTGILSISNNTNSNSTAAINGVGERSDYASSSDWNYGVMGQYYDYVGAADNGAAVSGVKSVPAGVNGRGVNRAATSDTTVNFAGVSGKFYSQTAIAKTTYGSAFHAHSCRVSAGTVDNCVGLKIEPQAGGVNNIGILLDGDGEGSDIVFGSNQESKLYGSAGDVVIDTATGKGLVIRSDSGNKCFRVTVNDAGSLSSTEVACQ